ncbi:MAG: tetratricopeptide repeat protein [Negativicutes bacterium]|nr:tetratricopeptide repeat protein [Negativicutes bacterium]
MSGYGWCEMKTYTVEEGLNLAHGGKIREAAIYFCQAVKEEPHNPEMYLRLGELLVALEEWDHAQACFGQLLALAPEHAEAYNYMGVILKRKEYLAEAEACYREAVELKPDYAEAFHNMGNCLLRQEKYAEAEAAYLKAVELQPDLLKARFSLGIYYLLMGQREKGWKWYDARLDWKDSFHMDIPIWQGESLAGRRILLFYEQGFGDMLHCFRYVPQIAAMAKAVTVWIQEPLARLLKEMKPAYKVCTSNRQLDAAQFDFACSIFSLPAKLPSLEAAVPYLWAAPKNREAWYKKLASVAKGRLKVGVVWAGNPEHSNDENRSSSFAEFRRLFTIPGVLWVNLQVGEEQKRFKEISDAERVFDTAGELTDFAETAGVIANLDLVIAVDTAVAHLAGAMGKPTWLLVPYHPEWRWELKREDCFWYPTMRLFRQALRGDWQEVLQRVAVALAEQVSSTEGRA